MEKQQNYYKQVVLNELVKNYHNKMENHINNMNDYLNDISIEDYEIKLKSLLEYIIENNRYDLWQLFWPYYFDHITELTGDVITDEEYNFLTDTLILYLESKLDFMLKNHSYQILYNLIRIIYILHCEYKNIYSLIRYYFLYAFKNDDVDVFKFTYKTYIDIIEKDPSKNNVIKHIYKQLRNCITLAIQYKSKTIIKYYIKNNKYKIYQFNQIYDTNYMKSCKTLPEKAKLLNKDIALLYDKCDINDGLIFHDLHKIFSLKRLSAYLEDYKLKCLDKLIGPKLCIIQRYFKHRYNSPYSTKFHQLELKYYILESYNIRKEYDKNGKNII